ncbi:hypothetical protein PUN28_018007 [Cardiocondyla obscurior]|uniref:Uncharacterized protein n=1 Tax=Cardiocondyla obscurior TaxID=286306 RepID=A0AAW2EGE7_9HYME
MARKLTLEKQDYDLIQVVVCNLYLFVNTTLKLNVTVKDAIENIDIGRVTLLCTAAKNHFRVIVICDPTNYERVINKMDTAADNNTSLQTLALKVFTHTAEYDNAISDFFHNMNPHQKSAQIFTILKKIFYQLCDALNGYQLVKELKSALNLPAATSFKHVSLAGAAVSVPLYNIQAKLCQGSFRWHYCTWLLARGSSNIEGKKKKKKKGGLYCVLQIDSSYILSPIERKTLYSLVMKHSVCYAKDGQQVVGTGTEQQFRIHCIRLTGDKADNWWLCQYPKIVGIKFKKNVKQAEISNAIDNYWIQKLDNVALSSDAFFPFRDNVDRNSVKFIVASPTGFTNDATVIDAYNKHGIALAHTGLLFFHH